MALFLIKTKLFCSRFTIKLLIVCYSYASCSNFTWTKLHSKLIKFLSNFHETLDTITDRRIITYFSFGLFNFIWKVKRVKSLIYYTLRWLPIFQTCRLRVRESGPKATSLLTITLFLYPNAFFIHQVFPSLDNSRHYWFVLFF